MNIEFSLSKSVDENAGRYFDLAKKAKKKIEGAKAALQESEQKLSKLREQEQQFWEQEQQKQEKKDRKREWYEKFHWFISSENFLCIGGKDSTSNDIIVKKHADKDDLILHTDMAGSPFFIIKNGQNASEKTIQEAAQAVGVYSKAWKLGHSSADVFYVKPEQVSKEGDPGEHMTRGMFKIRGQTKYVHPKLEYAIGLKEDQIIGGPQSAIEKQTKRVVLVIPGRKKKSDVAKKIRSTFKDGELDDIMAFLPSGGCEIKK